MTHSLEPGGFGAERIGLPSSSPAAQRSWHWQASDAAGRAVVVPALTARFPSQSDAETWLGECWRDLLDQGAEAVTLLEHDREVYGPMPLRP